MFAKLGKVISSAGSERFASDMHALLVESIPLAITRMTEWTLNEPAGEVVRVQSLGAFGAPGAVAHSSVPCRRVDACHSTSGNSVSAKFFRNDISCNEKSRCDAVRCSEIT